MLFTLTTVKNSENGICHSKKK